MSRTAIGVAAMRAAESERPDRLFDDPYAAAFVAAARAELPEPPAQPSGLGALCYPLAVLRTRFYDEFLLDAARAGCTQVVLLAAGLDTRGLRLAWPVGTRLFEIDLPEVLAFKQRVLAERDAHPTCARTAVAADLRTDWPARLRSAGFDSSVPTAWLIEGLLVYLSADDAGQLLESVGRLSAEGSRLSFEHHGDDRGELRARASSLPGGPEWIALLKGGLGEPAPEWLAERGWRCAVHPRSAQAAALGRELPYPSTGGYLTAVYGGS